MGIFPTRASALRLVGMILAEQDDKWQEGRRYFRPETMAAIDAATTEEVTPLLMASYRIRREDDRLLHHELGLDLTGTKTPEGTYSTRGLDAIAAFSVFSAPSG